MSQIPEITEIEELLYRADAMMGASEAHGALCGMICAQGSIELSEWADHVLGTQEQGGAALHDVVHKLSELHQATLEMLNDMNAEFRLLLADDDDPLADRVESLATWCQGFNYGLAAGGIREGSELPGDVAEFMRYMTEFSRAGVSDEEAEDPEQDEMDFIEIEGFVRIGVLNTYEELQPLQSTQTIH